MSSRRLPPAPTTAWAEDGPRLQRQKTLLPPLSATQRVALSRTTSALARMDGTAPASLIAAELGAKALGTRRAPGTPPPGGSHGAQAATPGTPGGEEGSPTSPERPWSSTMDASGRSVEATLPRALRAREERGDARQVMERNLVAAQRGARAAQLLLAVPKLVLWPLELDLRDWAMLVTDRTLELLAAINYERVAQARAARSHSRTAAVGASARGKKSAMGGTTTVMGGTVGMRRLATTPGVVWADPFAGGGVSEEKEESDELGREEYLRESCTRVLRVSDAFQAGDLGLKSVAESTCGWLQELDCAQVVRLTDAGLRSVAQSCPGLRRLVLDGCAGLTHGAGLAAVGDSCGALEELSARGVPAGSLQVWVMARVGRGLRRLRKLALDECAGLSDDALATAVRGSASALREVSVRGCVALTDVGIAALATQLTSVESLDISCPAVGKTRVSASRVSDVALQAIGDHCKALQCVRLEGLDAVTDVGVEWLVRGCTHLRTIDLGKCSKLSDSAARAIAAACPALENIHLGGCARVADRGAGTLLASVGTRLRHLDLHGCIMVSSGSAKHRLGLAAVFSNPPSSLPSSALHSSSSSSALHSSSSSSSSSSHSTAPSPSSAPALPPQALALVELDLSGCVQVGDEGLALLVRASQLSLRALNISRCTALTGRGLAVALQELGPRLEELDAAGLGEALTDGVIVRFARRSAATHSLTRIDCSGASKLTDRASSALLRFCLCLESLALDACPLLTDLTCFAASDAVGRVQQPPLDEDDEGLEGEDGEKRLAFDQKRRALISLVSSSLSTTAAKSTTAKSTTAKSTPFTPTPPSSSSSDFSGALRGGGLVTLRVGGARAVSDTGLSWLALRCARLCRLQVRGCSVSRSGLSSIATALDGVTVRWDDEWVGLWPRAHATQRRRLRDFSVRWFAAVRAQAWWRGQVGRRRAEAVARERERQGSVVRLQAWWRGERGRRRVAAIRSADARMLRAVSVVSRYVRWLAVLRRVRRRAAQRAIEHRDGCIRRVQAAWRRKRATRLAGVARELRTRRARELQRATVLAQRLFRGLVARRKSVRRKVAMRSLGRLRETAARKIQGFLRCAVARAERMRLRAARARAVEAARRAATAVQALLRGVLARRAVRRMRRWMAVRDAAATRIQACWRARQGRFAAYLLRVARRIDDEERAVLRVQRAWKRRQHRYARWVLQRAREAAAARADAAASLLQRVWRGSRARAEARRLRRILAYEARKRAHALRDAAVRIQCAWRGVLGRRRARALRKERARNWKIVRQDGGADVWYDTITGEIRKRKPQAVLDADPKPMCDDCAAKIALHECRDCHEMFCADCFGRIHRGGRRKAHAHRPLYDFYNHRVDYGDADWPSVWPTDILQDEMRGWTLHTLGNAGGMSSSMVAGTYVAGTVAMAGTSVGMATSSSLPPTSTPISMSPSSKQRVDARDARIAVAGGSASPEKREGGNDGFERRVAPDGSAVFVDTKRGVAQLERPIFYVTPRGQAPQPLDLGASGWVRFSVAGGDGKRAEYFWHPTSGATQWERPALFVTPRSPFSQAKTLARTSAPLPSPLSPMGPLGPLGYDTDRAAGGGGGAAQGAAEGGGAVPAWSKHVDETYGAEYFFNWQTGETSWERPPGFVTPRSGDVDALAASLSSAAQQPDPATLYVRGFAKFFDDASQLPYWTHDESGESTWERPAGWMTPTRGPAAETGGWFISPARADLG